MEATVAAIQPHDDCFVDPFQGMSLFFLYFFSLWTGI